MIEAVHPDTPLADARFAPEQRAPLPPSAPGPLVALSRNGALESVHYGAIVVCDLAGEVLAAAGDPALGCYSRSGAKPFQAIPLFGRADLLAEYTLTAKEMALICASHLGQPEHVEVGRSLFAKLGLDPFAVLKNGADPPGYPPALKELYRSGGEPSVLIHNCSGNHAGFLALAKAGGHDLERYQLADHPVQQPVHGLMAALAGIPERDVHIGIDNCGVPAYWLTLQQHATAYARLANPRLTAQMGLDFPFATDVFLHGARKVAGALWTEPFYAAGTGHLTTWVNTAGKGRFLGKNGAEGFYGIGVAGSAEYPQITEAPEGASWSATGPYAGRGIGIAIKLIDGDRIGRGMQKVVPEVLAQLGLVSREALAQTAEHLINPVRRTHRGERELGRSAPVFQLSQ